MCRMHEIESCFHDNKVMRELILAVATGYAHVLHKF